MMPVKWKWYIILVYGREVYRFQDTCLYNAKKQTKSWLITLGYNPAIIHYNTIEDK